MEMSTYRSSCQPRRRLYARMEAHVEGYAAMIVTRANLNVLVLALLEWEGHTALERGVPS